MSMYPHVVGSRTFRRQCELLEIYLHIREVKNAVTRTVVDYNDR